jgi:hypothetical protein
LIELALVGEIIKFYYFPFFVEEASDANNFRAVFNLLNDNLMGFFGMV